MDDRENGETGRRPGRVSTIDVDAWRVVAVGAGELWVMARPAPADGERDGFQALARHGLTAVVSLLERSEALELELGDEAARAGRHGLRFASWPIPDRGVPESAHAFGRFVRAMRADIAGGDRTVVHCRAGIGRTGLVAAAVLVADGVGVEDAFGRVSRARGVSVPDTPEQARWLARCVDRVAGPGPEDVPCPF